MRSTPLRRRLTYGVLSGGLVAGVLVPLSASAASCASPVVGTACTFPTGAPEPAASPAAGASPSASASASPSGSPEPSESASASPSPSPEAAPPPEPTVPVPAEGCVGFADAAGDARPSLGPVPFGNDPDLDLLSVTGRTTEDTVSGHLGIDELGRPRSPFSGHRFEYAFEVGGKKVVLRASGPGVATGLVDGTATADLSVSAVFDEVSSQVVLTVDRASLAKATGAELPDGAVLDDVSARSFAQTAATTSLADTARPEPPATATYVLGDDECFRPKMSIAAPAQVQTSDIALVNVSLVTSDGRVAREQTVIGRVGAGRAATAVTDARGTATLRVPVSDAAGVAGLVVRSTGEAGQGELRTTVRVLVERTLLSVKRSGSGSTRTLTATLTDDDAPRRRLAGQRVVFSFDGRTVGATTDRNGRAVATVPAGSVVDVAFAGRGGFLSAARTRTTS